MSTRPRPETLGARRQLKNHTVDSTRWDAIDLRTGDILICTAYRSGTSWMQRICSLLVFGATELSLSIDALSPWVDAPFIPLDQTVELVSSQDHRRFFKCHSPLTTMPYCADVSYVYVGRDPRDVAVSLWHHTRRSGRLDDHPRLADDFTLFLETWLTTGAGDGEPDGWPYLSYFGHAAGFWACRALPNVHLLHFQDLIDDLGGRMRWLARTLEQPVVDADWSKLVSAAGFDRMSVDPRVTPGHDQGLWSSPSQFFRSGRSRQWLEHFGPRERALYDEIVRDRLDPELIEWLHPLDSPSPVRTSDGTAPPASA